MLASIGIDIIEIDRVRQALRRWPRLAARLFTAGERAYCESRADPAPHYAARFAAKEAAAKTLGAPLRWHDVEVLRPQGGPPTIALHGRAAELAGARRGGRLLVSLSHCHEHAIACVALVLRQESALSDQNLCPWEV